jgi:hypothetical protein
VGTEEILIDLVLPVDRGLLWSAVLALIYLLRISVAPEPNS